MTKPSEKLRKATKLRDGNRCVACGVEGPPLEWQHRETSGHGGRGKKAPPLTTADGLMACTICNAGFEAEGQERALMLGHKIRRNRGSRLNPFPSHRIPYWDFTAQLWFLPDMEGGRSPIHNSLAQELLVAAGSIGRAE
jgi:hypothetical protein